MRIEIIRTDNEDPRFIALVEQLNQDLTKRYGNKQKAYDHLNQLVDIDHVVLLEVADDIVGCGAIKAFDAHATEVKRVFVKPDCRRQGYGLMILDALEKLAIHEGYQYTVLETGQRQKAAIKLYENIGYRRIDNYGPYVGNDNSLCFKKQLVHN